MTSRSPGRTSAPASTRQEAGGGAKDKPGIDEQGSNASRVASNPAGALAGAAAGAAAGAVTGLAAGPVGSLAGAVVGGATGAMAGSAAGGKGRAVAGTDLDAVAPAPSIQKPKSRGTPPRDTER